MIPNKHSLLHHQTEQAKRRPPFFTYIITALIIYTCMAVLSIAVSDVIALLFHPTFEHKLLIFICVLSFIIVFLLAKIVAAIVANDDSPPDYRSPNPTNDAYSQLTELSDMLESRDVPDKEVLRIVDEVREKMRKERTDFNSETHGSARQ